VCRVLKSCRMCQQLHEMARSGMYSRVAFQQQQVAAQRVHQENAKRRAARLRAVIVCPHPSAGDVGSSRCVGCVLSPVLLIDRGAVRPAA